MTAVITCPECDKKFKAPEDAKGKKIRCPACRKVFVVEELAIDQGGRAVAAKAAPAKAAPAKAAAAPPKPVEPPKPAPAPAAAAAAKPFDDDDDDANPGEIKYGVGTLDIRARCPTCANLMESEDAVICLFCGYNTLTRVIGETKKVIAHSHVDRGAWLMPGIACVAVIFTLIGFQIAYIFGLFSLTRGSDRWYWNLLNSESLRLWTTIMMLGVIWGLLQFAQKRLLFEPTPPEIEKD
jgi:hypothetical protein